MTGEAKVPDDISSLCGDCAVAPGQGHDLRCDVARCPYCGTQRYDCLEGIGCEEGRKADRPAIWKGRWDTDIATERYGLAKSEIYRLIEAGLFVWDRDDQGWKLREGAE
ncbi:hypothetical protein [Streptosporangium lutulentum]|uniref:Uncharacterized protein n=1 Tax=Streptosporangium lutulentum TaxID=1461250 RepID=A0ABT9Q985_9ACTN|nr:hypothetical protein [Streptosporangium lutulentum]MDP9843284.1 hypothetical protein [Streptosporangium lutulentum]